MPLFVCEKCGYIENTATSRYWIEDEGIKLCSKCDPELGCKWHGCFPRTKYDGSQKVIKPEHYFKHYGNNKKD